ncbi:MAG: 16S rRNA (adenine(1518)-N(6)/adenine(1519)-N(6))-dimethyltransferase RsmA [Alphaproteobacteria bacterium]|nr:16S rRNA (adenine(1518)-N(6)/adenine(1519)-N(6))-dimethyltransferase RsmA [Alphaproteobacteria bacterium]
MSDSEAPLTSLPSLRDVMARHDLLPKKSLGQNFLLDGNITDKVARAAGDLRQTHVIEVGPGPGGLTRSLLHAGAVSLTAIEKDSRCVAALEELREVVGERFTIIGADALTVDVTTLCPAPRAIVANLPYNVATPLLIGWLEQIAKDRSCLSGMTLMFQKEVAERIAAAPGSKTYGRLAVMAQWQCEVHWRFDLPPSVFTPPPKVHSSVVHFKPRPAPLVEVAWEVMERVVEKAFGQRRKMLRSALKGMVADTEGWLKAAGIDPESRAEQLSVAQFGALAVAYADFR